MLLKVLYTQDISDWYLLHTGIRGGQVGGPRSYAEVTGHVSRNCTCRFTRAFLCHFATPLLCNHKKESLQTHVQTD